MTAMTPVLYHYPGSICSQMARLALAEKGVAYEGRVVDIMDRAEQFAPWYVALNPKAVVPTLVLGAEVVTDTKRIVARVDADFDGPALSPPEPDEMRRWMDEIMGLHYGVLLYARRIGPDGTLPRQITERGEMLRARAAAHPDQAELLQTRIAGNARMQAILRDPAQVESHVAQARDLVARMADALAARPFIAGETWSLADAFATAALARFRLHGFEGWWAGTPVAEYYARMRSRPSFAAAGVTDSGGEHAL